MTTSLSLSLSLLFLYIYIHTKYMLDTRTKKPSRQQCWGEFGVLAVCSFIPACWTDVDVFVRKVQSSRLKLRSAQRQPVFVLSLSLSGSHACTYPQRASEEAMCVLRLIICWHEKKLRLGFVISDTWHHHHHQNIKKGRLDAYFYCADGHVCSVAIARAPHSRRLHALIVLLNN
jgi:hypothetical protein